MNILSDSFTIRAGDIIHCRRFFFACNELEISRNIA
jgi:hypothetical protein